MNRAILGNSHRNLAALLIAPVFLLADCGGGGGGGGGAAPLASGTFTRTFGTSGGGNQVPFGIGTFGDVTSQALYTPTDVGGSGRITKLRFQNSLANAGPITCPNTTVRLGHSSLATLTTTFANNTNRGTPVVVFNNATVTVPAAAGASFDIALTTPFDYNGVDNLVVQVDRTTVCSGAAIFGVDTVSLANRRAYSSAADTTPGIAQNNTTTASTIDSAVAWMQFVFAGGDALVPAADRAGNNSNFNAPASTGRVQYLILASDITGSGPITGIQFAPPAALAAPLTATNKITLSHVAAATTQLASTTFASNVGSGATVVAQNVPVSLPVGTTEWWVPLSGAFSYDGTSNLLIDVETTVTAGGATLAYQNAGGNRILRGTATTDTTGVFWQRGLEPKLRFHGGQVVVVPPSAGSTFAGQALGSTSPGGQVQSLYRNDLIGTSGTINAVYVRLLGSSVAGTLTNYKLYMGHTAKTTYVLTDTYASNMNENATVFSGTLNVPAGLVAGDWVKIPLASPFAYDSSKNLSILFTSDFVAAGNNVTMRSDANRFPSSTVGRNDNAVTTSGTPVISGSVILDLAIDLSK